MNELEKRKKMITLDMYKRFMEKEDKNDEEVLNDYYKFLSSDAYFEALDIINLVCWGKDIEEKISSKAYFEEPTDLSIELRSNKEKP